MINNDDWDNDDWNEDDNLGAFFIISLIVTCFFLLSAIYCFFADKKIADLYRELALFFLDLIILLTYPIIPIIMAIVLFNLLKRNYKYIKSYRQKKK